MSSEVTKALAFLRRYIPAGELAAIRDAMRRDDAPFFRAKVVELARLIAGMPGLYAQEKAGEHAIVHLHYFTGSADWWITEVSADGEAFGKADLYGDGGEYGYISLPELVAAGAELDLHWRPCEICKCGRAKPAEPAAPVTDLKAEGETLRLEGEQQGAIGEEDGDWPL